MTAKSTLSNIAKSTCLNRNNQYSKVGNTRHVHCKLQSLKSKSSWIVISDQSILRFKYKSLRFELKLQTFGIKPEILRNQIF